MKILQRILLGLGPEQCLCVGKWSSSTGSTEIQIFLSSGMVSEASLYLLLSSLTFKCCSGHKVCNILVLMHPAPEMCSSAWLCPVPGGAEGSAGCREWGLRYNFRKSHLSQRVESWSCSGWDWPLRAQVQPSAPALPHVPQCHILMFLQQIQGCCFTTSLGSLILDNPFWE